MNSEVKISIAKEIAHLLERRQATQNIDDIQTIFDYAERICRSKDHKVWLPNCGWVSRL